MNITLGPGMAMMTKAVRVKATRCVVGGTSQKL